MSDLRGILEGDGYVCVDLLDTDHGQVMVGVDVDGHKGKMILDTGASRSIIEQQAATNWGITGDPHDEDGTGAGGSVAMSTALVESFDVGPLRLGNTGLLIADLGPVNQRIVAHGGEPIQGVLGAEILHAHDAVIDYRSAGLYLKPTPKAL